MNVSHSQLDWESIFFALNKPLYYALLSYFFSVVLILFEGGTQLDYFNENHKIIMRSFMISCFIFKRSQYA